MKGNEKIQIFPCPAIQQREERERQDMGIFVDVMIPYRGGNGQGVGGKPPATLAAALFEQEQVWNNTMCQF